MSCVSVPPAATLTTCSPRHTASSGVVACEGKLRKRKLERVARGVRFVRLRMPRVAVVGGVDVAAAGKEHAVEAVECGRCIHRKHTRVAAGPSNGFDVVGQPVGRCDADDGHYISRGYGDAHEIERARQLRTHVRHAGGAPEPGGRLLLVEDRIPVIKAVEHLCQPERVFCEYRELQRPNDLLDDFIEARGFEDERPQIVAASLASQLGSVDFAKRRKHAGFVDLIAVAQLGKNVLGANDSIL